MKRLLIIVVFFVATHVSLGQDRAPYVWEGGIQLSYKRGDNWSFASAVGQRTVWIREEAGTSSRLNFLELDQFATYQMTSRLKGSFGYKFRSNDPVPDLTVFEHRLTQQLAYIHSIKAVRLVSRARAEQRIREDSYANRFRYRLSADFPLNGEKLDPKEFYAVMSNELLYETVNVEPNTWENRINGSLGYMASRSVKMEVSLTYRMEDLTREIIPLLFINTGVFIKLD